MRVLLHVLPGLIALALATIVVLTWGSRRQKVTLTAVLVCWIGGTIGQVVTGHITAPLIAADVVFAFWILWYASGKTEWWIWTLLALAGLQRRPRAAAGARPPGIPYSTLYDALSLGGLAVLAVAAIIDAHRAASEPRG